MWNKTDGSVAIITNVAANVVTTTRLLGGSDNTWQSADVFCIDPFVLTLEKVSTNAYGVQSTTQREEVLVTARSTDTLTVPTGGRGYNGTVANTFDASDYAYLHVTSPIVERLRDILSVVAAQVNTNVTDIDNIESGASFYAAATGASNAYAVTLSPAPTAYSAGLTVRFKANHTTSGAATLNVNGLGAVSVKRLDGVTDVTAEEIKSGQLLTVVHDGTNFQMQSPPGRAGAGPEAAVYGAGSDGVLNVASGTTTIDLGGLNYVVKQYTSINVSAGATLAFSNPHASGTIIVLKSQGNVTFAGTVNASGLGATGGVSVNVSRTSSGHSSSAGTAGTNATNSLGQTRNGAAGLAQALATSNAAASGGGGSASTELSGTASGVATGGTASAAAASAGAGITAGLSTMGHGGIVIAPGAGGSSGGVAVSVNAYTSGTFTATSGAAGRGGGALLVYCGGNYTGAGGTVTVAGTNASAGSLVTGAATNWHVAAGGSSGGAGGTFLVLARGSITFTGTHTVAAGTSSNGTSSGTGANAHATNGGGSANGTALALQMPLGY